MELWAASLLFVFFASASAFFFFKGGKRNVGVRILAILFALLGILVLAYAAATLFFVASIE